jgi:shikimate kinase
MTINDEFLSPSLFLCGKLSEIKDIFTKNNGYLFMKIYLIGFMGSGKSYVGQQLAQLLDYLYVDTDNLIENTEGSSIAQLFEAQGEAAFREIERANLHGLSKWDNIIVATGGGMPCFHDNMAYINDSGISVYLKTKPHLLLERLLPESEKRPLLRGYSETELLAFIESKVAEREQFYGQADIIIHQNSNEQAVAQEILTAIYDLHLARTKA